MKYIVNAKNTTVTPSLQAYVEKKFSKLNRFVDDDTTIYTKIEVKDNGKRHKVEVTIPVGKNVVRAEVNNTDMYAGIDEAENVLTRSLKRIKEKRIEKHRNPKPIEVEEEVIPYNITRIKTHELYSMTAQEACEAMELVGHSFYVYRDVDRENAICVVYEKDNGEYGNLLFV